ncbi:MAG: DNA-protecting protein DprA [Flavobacteriales bacterium CG_4_9_14_3_um_filter_40_17]|nr:MAG: DNA-protecting protein DprA [Flavobacteriales bacterium CG_4_9_14_3_um_filter_40_17]
MTPSELLYRLALQRVAKIGDITAKKLIAHCRSAEAVFKEKKERLLKIDGIGELIANALKNSNFLKEAEAEMKFIEREKLQVWTFDEPGYPDKLRECIDGPVLLFAKGNISFEDCPILSIVGTRHITPYGIDFCEKLIADLTPLNPIIVSGLAYGVDIQAHKQAIKNNLQTIACLAHGLNQIYPKAHQKYIADILENGGLVTDFWSTSQPERENFLQRNRIIAGLSEATLVVESAAKGGSLVTADIAGSYGREVFAVPGRSTDYYSQGCNNLIKSQKAQLICSAAEIVFWLNWDVNEVKSKTPIQKQLFLNLNDEEQKLYDFLKSQGQQPIDMIAIGCNMPTYKIASHLLNMELQGAIRPLPGKVFEVI